MKQANSNPAEHLLKEFFKRHKERDLVGLLSLFCKNTTCYGTATDEYRVGLKEIEMQFKRDWSQSESCEMEMIAPLPTPPGANWVSGVIRIAFIVEGKKYVMEDLRGTLIATQEDGQWKIAHLHASFPDYRNPENNSFPVDS